MPTRKTPRKTAKKSSSKIPEPALSKAYEEEISYETKIIITIILLLFVYPIGLIFMWWWMKNWPLWLKLLLTLPFIVGIFLIFALLFFVGTIISHVKLQERMQEKSWQYMSVTPVASTTPNQTY